MAGAMLENLFVGFGVLAGLIAAIGFASAALVRRHRHRAPNEVTVAAMKEARSGGGQRFKSVSALMEDLNTDE